MTTAIVVFADIEGFTRKLEVRQKNLVDAMTADVHHEIRDLLVPPTGEPRAVVLPTGDGLAAAIVKVGDHRENFTRALSLAARMFLFAREESVDGDDVRLRVGIHVGGVEYVTDVNGRTNICGGTINLAQRVMDASNPGQCLISEEVREKCLDRDGPCDFPVFRHRQGQMVFSDPHEVMVKHGQRMTVRVAELSCDGKLISAERNKEPVSKNQTLLSFTNLPKNIDLAKGFGLELGTAVSVGLIQLTGENLIAKLQNGEVTFSTRLERLWVLMPSPEWLVNAPFLPLPNAEAQRGHVKVWKKYLAKFAKERKAAHIRLCLFDEPPFFGASLLDWDRQVGRIHVSPYVWNTPTKSCPGFDISWSDNLFPPVAQAYVDGLNHLADTSRDVLEKG